ncbi:hypothetical protein NHX12_029822 [Muraenolepis orangiensis]|uniref:Uncharacterized protein n=1 Tax=Muraenolepis orangiensis TaxID=630683 RepID=A0A9Q0E6Q3_9TELE|nr:hypothetical protein NHX12_029822 [Muraenolepis orangiensis]
MGEEERRQEPMVEGGPDWRQIQQDDPHLKVLMERVRQGKRPSGQAQQDAHRVHLEEDIVEGSPLTGVLCKGTMLLNHISNPILRVVPRNGQHQCGVGSDTSILPNCYPLVGGVNVHV